VAAKGGDLRDADASTETIAHDLAQVDVELRSTWERISAT
jgi:hypothetical protein